MKVLLSPLAEADIADIGKFIEIDNPNRAAGFTRELAAACRTIGQFPFGSPPLDADPASGMRRKVYGRYLIVYRVGAQVEILRILHGARDVRRALKLGDP